MVDSSKQPSLASKKGHGLSYGKHTIVLMIILNDLTAIGKTSLTKLADPEIPFYSSTSIYRNRPMLPPLTNLLTNSA